MTDYFRHMFTYDAYVNAQVLTRLQEASNLKNRTRHVFAHLLAAQKVWLLRLRERDASGQAIWPDLSLAGCGGLLEENRNSYAHYLEGVSEADLNDTVQYQNSKGALFETSAQDILSHVLVHSGYHRGQVASALRAAGAEPVNTDYITYVRNL